MNKRVTDERLLEALLVHGGVSGAAAVLGISKNAIYKRLRDPVFRQAFDASQGAILSAASAALAGALDDAIRALVDVVNDPEASAGIKVQAANALLAHCCRYVESANILRRLDELEQEVHRESN